MAESCEFSKNVKMRNLLTFYSQKALKKSLPEMNGA